MAKNQGMTVEVLEDRHVHLTHKYNSVSTKNYRWIVVRVYIPSGISVAPLWLLNDKQMILL